ncbi:hypothetical protein CDD83_5641 [Cordyceps sp. RAO-2017]|nr:hypothetical protein CDD83_5641 [Cordyceps sp. RAO-2017]
MRQQGVRPGETVAIQGIGGLGHLGIQYARKMGYRVVAISSGGAKRELALQLGAHHYIDSSATSVTEEVRKLGGAKMIVITAPDPNLMGQYTACLAWQGKLVILARNTTACGELTLSSNDLVLMSSSVSGWHAGGALDCEEAIEFARLHDVRCMTESFPLERIQEAADRLRSSKARFRVVLTMQ